MRLASKFRSTPTPLDLVLASILVAVSSLIAIGLLSVPAQATDKIIIQNDTGQDLIFNKRQSTAAVWAALPPAKIAQGQTIFAVPKSGMRPHGSLVGFSYINGPNADSGFVVSVRLGLPNEPPRAVGWGAISAEVSVSELKPWRYITVTLRPVLSFELRKLTDPDCELTEPIRAQIRQLDMQTFGLTQYNKEWELALHAKGLYALGAYNKEELVGVVLAHPKDNGWYIARVGVHPNFQRNGIGKTLLRRVLDHIGDKAVTLRVRSSSPAARLYESLGFRHCEILDWRYTNPDGEAEIMRRDATNQLPLTHSGKL
jgi:ribosomal protein S18 acetylase RimI-like enzyme